MLPIMRKTPSTGAGCRYVAPYAELCAFEPTAVIAQSGKTEDISYDNNEYVW